MGIPFDRTEYLLAAFRSSKAGDDFFNSFNFGGLLNAGKYADLINSTIDLLTELKHTNYRAYYSIHKGTPFYWMGVAAILSNDFLSATHFFDAAVSEDLQTKKNPVLLESPSMLFALLNDCVPYQAAREIVTILKMRILEIVNTYNDHLLNSNSLSFDLIREELFKKTLLIPNHPWRSLYTSFIAFFGEYYYQKSIIQLRDRTGSYSFYFIHLFRGCLLFESLLKENPKINLPKNVKTLNRALKFLKLELMISEENTNIGNITLPDVLLKVNEFQLDIPKSIEITGNLRNTIGHNLAWEIELDSLQYDKLFLAVAFSCLHAINCLYSTKKPSLK